MQSLFRENNSLGAQLDALEVEISLDVMENPSSELLTLFPHVLCNYSCPPKIQNLTGAASHGRKVRIGSVWALEASVVQYCQNWCHILVPVGSTTKDLYTKVFNHVESYNLYKRGTSLMSTIRKLEFLGLLWAGCSFLYFISKNSKFKDIEWE